MSNILFDVFKIVLKEKIQLYFVVYRYWINMSKRFPLVDNLWRFLFRRNSNFLKSKFTFSSTKESTVEYSLFSLSLEVIVVAEIKIFLKRNSNWSKINSFRWGFCFVNEGSSKFIKFFNRHPILSFWWLSYFKMLTEKHLISLIHCILLA